MLSVLFSSTRTHLQNNSRITLFFRVLIPRGRSQRQCESSVTVRSSTAREHPAHGVWQSQLELNHDMKHYPAFLCLRRTPLTRKRRPGSTMRGIINPFGNLPATTDSVPQNSRMPVVAMAPPINSLRQATIIPMQVVKKPMIRTVSVTDSLNGLIPPSPTKNKATRPTKNAASSRAIQRRDTSRWSGFADRVFKANLLPLTRRFSTSPLLAALSGYEVSRQMPVVSGQTPILPQHPHHPAYIRQADYHEKQRQPQPQTAAMPGRSVAAKARDKRLVRTAHD